MCREINNIAFKVQGTARSEGLPVQSERMQYSCGCEVRILVMRTADPSCIHDFGSSGSGSGDVEASGEKRILEKRIEREVDATCKLRHEFAHRPEESRRSETAQNLIDGNWRRPGEIVAWTAKGWYRDLLGNRRCRGLILVLPSHGSRVRKPEAMGRKPWHLWQ